MSAAAFALVITAGLLHSIWNIAAKRSGGDDRFALIAGLLLLLIWAPVGVWAGWGVLGQWGWREWCAVLASAVVHLVYFQTLLRGYRLSDLTVVYPVARGSGPLVGSAAAVLLLGESMSALGVAGVLTITGGVFLIAGGPSLLGKAHDPAQRQRVLAGVRWGGATGLLIACYTVIDGYAVKVLLISPILVDYLGNVLRIPLLLPGALADRAGFMRDLRTQWKAALVLATFSPVAYAMVLYAVQMAPLSHVAPAREISMLFAALLGGHLLGEADRGARLIGAACMATGVVLLAW